MNSSRRSPVLELVKVGKRFGPIEALLDVSFSMYHGDVIGLVGDNGAGKSTLVKIISGAHTVDSGEVWFDGERVTFVDPSEARQLGIETVYQDLSLVEEFDASGNFFLGRELFTSIGRWLGGTLAKGSMRRETLAAIANLNVEIPDVAWRPVAHMSGGQRQAIAISRAVHWGQRLLLLDEPTAALGVAESGEVLRLVRDIGSTGLPVIMISHNLEHVLDVCNRVVVMRHGQCVMDAEREGLNVDDVVAAITGAKAGQSG